MGRFDRYMLSQLLLLFGLFALILVSIHWINRAVALFDQLISSGQSALVFLEFTTLSLPAMVRSTLPLAGFTAVIWVVNRMHNESEFVIVQATGFSPWRLARPVFVFGVFLVMFLLVLSHVLTPISRYRLKERQIEIAQDMTSQLLREGVFVHASPGVTFFVDEISPNGALSDVMLSDNRDREARATYTATRAMLTRQNDKTLLVLLDGLAQFFDETTGKLSTTGFDSFVYDVTELTSGSDQLVPRLRDYSSLRLLGSNPPTEFDPVDIRALLHTRTAEAFFALAGALIAVATLMVGRFSRFGLWYHIGAAVLLVTLTKAIDNRMISVVQRDPANWPALYVGAAVGLLAALALLVYSANAPVWKQNKSTPQGGSA